MSILTCPSCGFSYCSIFYGFTLVFPNFDSPKMYKIELKFICTKKNKKILSIDLGQYLKIIELNSKFKNNNLEEDDSNNNNNQQNISDYEEMKKQIMEKDFKNIINRYKDIVSTNEKEINKYINKEKSCLEKHKFFLQRYIELNNQLYFFIKIFMEIISKNQPNNLLTSYYYISKLAGYFKDLDNPKFYIQKNILNEFITTGNGISKLPFILKLVNNYLISKDSEILDGHTLPIVGLYQMRNGLLLSGSCGILNIWKKNDDINDENFNKFQLLQTINQNRDLVRCFNELENDIIIFCKGHQIIEALINEKDKYQEKFSYDILGSSLESLVALNQNKNFAAGLYTKLLIFERNKKKPILTLQYHRLFIMKMISIPKLNLFCSSGSDNKVIIYNSSNFEFHSQFEFEESHIVSLCNYNDTEFCCSTMGGKIWYFKRNEIDNLYEKIGPINAHLREIYGILQIKNGQVVSTSRDCTIKFWNIPKQICICKITLDKNNNYDHIWQLEDGRLCFASCNRKIKIFNNLPFLNIKYLSFS